MYASPVQLSVSTRQGPLVSQVVPKEGEYAYSCDRSLLSRKFEARHADGRLLCADTAGLGTCSGGPYRCAVNVHGSCFCKDLAPVDKPEDLGYLGWKPLGVVASKLSSSVIEGVGRALLASAAEGGGLEHAVGPFVADGVASTFGSVSIVTLSLSMSMAIVNENINRLNQVYLDTSLDHMMAKLATVLGSDRWLRERVTGEEPIMQCFMELVDTYEIESRQFLKHMDQSVINSMPVHNRPNIYKVALQEVIERDTQATNFKTRFVGMLKPTNIGHQHMRISYTHLRTFLKLLVTEYRRLSDGEAFDMFVTGLKKMVDPHFRSRRAGLMSGIVRPIGISADLTPEHNTDKVRHLYAHLPVYLGGNCGQPTSLTRLSLPPRLSRTNGFRDVVGSAVQFALDEQASRELVAEVKRRYRPTEEDLLLARQGARQAGRGVGLRRQSGGRQFETEAEAP